MFTIAGATGLLQLRIFSSSSQLNGKDKVRGFPHGDRRGLLRLRPRTSVVRQIERVVRFPTITCSSASGGAAVPVPEPNKGAWSDVLGRLNGSEAPPSLSDIVWPSLGGFVAMAAMGCMDTLLAPKGLTFTMGSFAAVCVLLFAAPKAPVSQKYNVYVSHLGCAALGVIALGVFGPVWIARAVALAGAIAFMQYTGSLHPPAAALPLIMIDMQKMHHLQWWYVIYPGFIGCIFLFLLQEAVEFLRNKWRF